MFLNTFLIHANLKPVSLQPAPLTRRPSLKKAPETASHSLLVPFFSFWIYYHMPLFSSLKLKTIYTECKKIHPRILHISPLDRQALGMHRDDFN